MSGLNKIKKAHINISEFAKKVTRNDQTYMSFSEAYEEGRGKYKRRYGRLDFYEVDGEDIFSWIKKERAGKPFASVEDFVDRLVAADPENGVIKAELLSRTDMIAFPDGNSRDIHYVLHAKGYDYKEAARKYISNIYHERMDAIRNEEKVGLYSFN